MPRIWVINPENGKNQVKLTLKTLNSTEIFGQTPCNLEKFNLTISAKIDYCETQFFKRTYSPKFRVKYV